MTPRELELLTMIEHDLGRIANALEALANCSKADVFQTEDVARAKVYSEHLGGKLREQSGDTSTTP